MSVWKTLQREKGKIVRGEISRFGEARVGGGGSGGRESLRKKSA